MTVRDDIVRAAEEEGIDPAEALAVADRESSFNPDAHASKTIYGLFQMSAPLRRQFGAGDSADPYTQARAWMRFRRDMGQNMAATLGRDPTAQEAYLGHYFGPGRAAKMISGAIAPDTPVGEVFTPQELEGNPNIVRAGTIGKLVSSVSGDMGKRIARFGGTAPTLGGTDPDPRPPPSGDRWWTPMRQSTNVDDRTGELSTDFYQTMTDKGWATPDDTAELAKRKQRSAGAAPDPLPDLSNTGLAKQAGADDLGLAAAMTILPGLPPVPTSAPPGSAVPLPQPRPASAPPRPPAIGAPTVPLPPQNFTPNPGFF